MTFLGWLSDPFKGLSDLQLGDEKVTLNHLGKVFFFFRGSPHEKSSKVGFFGTGAKFDLFVGGEVFFVGGGKQEISWEVFGIVYTTCVNWST